MARAGAALALLALGGCAFGTDAPPPRPEVAARPAVAPAPAPPRWRPRAVVADAPTGPARVAVARAGDTIATLAARERVAVGALAVAAGRAADAPLTAGARIAVPAGRHHAVKPGETGIAIARAYATPWRRIVAANGLAAPFTLEVGERLLIPAPVAARRLTLAERADANRLDIDDLLTGSEPASASRRAPAAPATARAVGAAPGATPPPTRPGAPAAAFAAAPWLEWPIEGRILSRFGAKPGGRFNDGINIAAVPGTPVKAAAEGVVIYAGASIAAFGQLVLLRHAGGWVTAYAHNESLLVAKGERVARGAAIARAGATGEVDAPQLHFEVRRGRAPVDPLGLLSARATG